MSTPMGREALESWLIERLASELGMPEDEVDLREGLAAYGLDSVAATGLVQDLERLLGRPVSPTLFWELPTLALACERLAGDSRRGL